MNSYAIFFMNYSRISPKNFSNNSFGKASKNLFESYFKESSKKSCGNFPKNLSGISHKFLQGFIQGLLKLLLDISPMMPTFLSEIHLRITPRHSTERFLQFSSMDSTRNLSRNLQKFLLVLFNYLKRYIQEYFENIFKDTLRNLSKYLFKRGISANKSFRNSSGLSFEKSFKNSAKGCFKYSSAKFFKDSTRISSENNYSNNSCRMRSKIILKSILMESSKKPLGNSPRNL